MSKLHAPKWVVFSIDVILICLSVFSAYMLRFNFNFGESINQNLFYAFALILPIRIISFVISKTYAGLVRYTSTNDAIRICITIITGSLVALSFNYLFVKLNLTELSIPLSVLLIDCVLSIAFMSISRFIVKALYFDYRSHQTTCKNVVIYGANEFALTTKRTLDRDAGTNYHVVAFLDQSNNSVGKSIDGIKVWPLEKLEEIILNQGVKMLILSEQLPNTKQKQSIIDICLSQNVKVLSTPKVSNWINGELSFKQIRQIKIEDLLERDPIKLDEMEIRKDLVNKTILVTGAAGSIGSEIVRQVAKFNPKTIVIFDQAESPLYDLELELQEKLNFFNFEIVIGSVTDSVRLTAVFEKFHPSVIYHAAAYKHVPMMENNPSQAIQNNVFGTKLLADFAVKYKVNKFVMISTDKAVNPTNVMGCSKRICEIYTQSLNSCFPTKFITTRFGNVLGSNGSVIPRFKAQIEKGGPVTVTDPKITRFFMTIPEACQLVLQAGTLGNGGEIFVFDMGKSVKIIDLAKKMIKLSGLTLGKDIQISFTGLRPGEKLYEEVLNDKETTLPTSHSQIMVAKVREYDFAQVSEQINQLIGLVKCGDNFKIVGMMKRIVPEFKSENSVYEVLDTNRTTESNAAEISEETAKKSINGSKPQIFVNGTNGSSVSIGKKFSLMR